MTTEVLHPAAPAAALTETSITSSNAAHLRGRPRFLLARPDAFDITYAINPFMDPGTGLDRELAQRQWAEYRAALAATGAQIFEQPAADGCPDLVFANNAALVLDGRALMSRFRHAERVVEELPNRIALESLGFSTSELPAAAGSFEGAADAMPFAGRLLCAYGPRTSQSVIPYLAAFSGLQPVPLELVDPRFYHLDVAFCSLDGERAALVAPDAFSRESWERLRPLVPDAVLVSTEEAIDFCCNSVVVGHTVFMHRVPDRLGRALDAAGYTAVEQPVGEFLKSGGSLACMSLRLDRTADYA